jgi:hypothetical protein
MAIQGEMELMDELVRQAPRAQPHHLLHMPVGNSSRMTFRKGNNELYSSLCGAYTTDDIQTMLAGWQSNT